MINAQLIKPIPLSGCQASADLHGDTGTLWSQRGRSCSAVEAQLPDQGLKRCRADSSPRGHREVPSLTFWGAFFFPSSLGCAGPPPPPTAPLQLGWAEGTPHLQSSAFHSASPTAERGLQGTASLTFFRFVRVAAVYSWSVPYDDGAVFHCVDAPVYSVTHLWTHAGTFQQCHSHLHYCKQGWVSSFLLHLFDLYLSESLIYGARRCRV